MLLSSRKAILKKCIDLENELRGLLKVFGVRLPMRVGYGSCDQLVRATVTRDPLLARAWVPLLDARTMLYKTYLQLDNAVKAIVRIDAVRAANSRGYEEVGSGQPLFRCFHPERTRSHENQEPPKVCRRRVRPCRLPGCQCAAIA